MNLTTIVSVTRYTDMADAVRISFLRVNNLDKGPLEFLQSGKLPQVYEVVSDVLLPKTTAENLLRELQSALSGLVLPPTGNLKVEK